MSGIIDSHAHLTWESYAQDQKEVIERAFNKAVVQIVQAGTDIQSIPEMLRLSEDYPQIFVGVGVHPHEAKFWDNDAGEIIRDVALHPKVVAVGECGLDYYYNHSDRSAQLQAFRAQVMLAKELNKPLIVHCRDAWDDALAILEEEGGGKVRGVFHCFTGGPDLLPRIEALDFYLSFSGILTFANAKNVQAAAPVARPERLLVETDCPYLAPQPVRGKRNEPAYVWMVAQKLADLRGTTLEDIAAITARNARELFGLPEPTSG